jgi:hypothetical protein
MDRSRREVADDHGAIEAGRRLALQRPPQLDGVRSARVSVPDRTVDVDYDESVVGLDAIKDSIVEQGYDVPA